MNNIKCYVDCKFLIKDDIYYDTDTDTEKTYHCCTHPKIIADWCVINFSEDCDLFEPKTD